MLRPFPGNPKGFSNGDEVIRMKDCPDCIGRGWFLIRPFLSGGSNGHCGIENSMQCPTCEEAYLYFNKHGELPPDIDEALKRRVGR